MQKFFLDDEEYSLTDAQAEEVDVKDRECPRTDEGNIEFNKWFRNFAKTNYISSVNRRMARYWTNTVNSKEEIIKYAVTLRAMRSMVSVLDSEHNLRVTFKPEIDTSAWADDNVFLPMKPIKDSDSLHDAINLEGGFALHEAMHSKHTRPLLTKKLRDYLKESPVNMLLSNLIEDVRIESEEMKENPGFRPYLEKATNYLWNSGGEEYLASLPDKWDECNTQQKIHAAIAEMNKNAKDFLREDFKEPLNNVRNIINTYIESKKPDVITTVDNIKSVLKLTDENPEGKSEGEESDRDGSGDGKSPPKLLPCEFTHDHDNGMTNEKLDRVSDLVDQEVESLDVKDHKKWMVESEGSNISSITVYRPKVEESVSLPLIDGLLAKAKAALEFRKAVPRADERMMLSGELDEDELYRLFNNDPRVFRDITEDVVPSAAVYLLVDISGSMSSLFNSYYDAKSEYVTRVDVAQKMAYLLVASMKSKPHVNVRVLAHTGNNSGSSLVETRYGGTASFYRIWEEGDSYNRLSLLQTISRGENYDSYAIAWAGDMLAQEEAEQKLLIVLSDGQPAGSSYGGASAMDHVRLHVDRLARKNVDTVQISMTSELDEKYQKWMFKHYIVAPRGSEARGMYHTILHNLQKILFKISCR